LAGAAEKRPSDLEGGLEKPADFGPELLRAKIKRLTVV